MTEVADKMFYGVVWSFLSVKIKKIRYTTSLRLYFHSHLYSQPHIVFCERCNDDVDVMKGSWISEDFNAIKPSYITLFVFNVAMQVGEKCWILYDVKKTYYWLTTLKQKEKEEENLTDWELRIYLQVSLTNDKHTYGIWSG